VSADNITGRETDSDDALAEAEEAKFGAWSSSDDGPAPVCELVDETAGVSISGDLACGDEPEENHLRVAGIGTGAVSDGGPPSTLPSSSFGGVGGMTFITGGCVVVGIGGSL
jgi:hypothetical protein